MSGLAIVDRFPPYRHGLSVALSQAGFQVEETVELQAWGSQTGRRIAVFSIRGLSDIRDLRHAVARNRDLAVVAIHQQDDLVSLKQTLDAGATACLPAGASMEEIVGAVHVAAKGLSLIPTDVLRDLVRSQGRAPEACPLSGQEIEWLRSLARGTTVTRLADSVCYSEREMYRRLHDLYLRMGVTGRTEAVVRAARWGVLDGGWDEVEVTELRPRHVVGVGTGS
jgi:DNA-binding NarL/FixJ family response regulator